MSSHRSFTLSLMELISEEMQKAAAEMALDLWRKPEPTLRLHPAMSFNAFAIELPASNPERPKKAES